MNQPGYITLLLTMHLPDLSPNGSSEVERRWFVDTMIESYLPTFEILDRLSQQGGSWRLALAPSPTLMKMLTDPALGETTAKAIETRQKIVQREMDRNRHDESLYLLAEYYDNRLARIKHILNERCSGIPIRALQDYAKCESIEIIAGPDTQAYLPALTGFPEAIRSQIRNGLDCVESLLGVRPSGFLLPEMGYDPSLAPILVEEGVLYTFVESHSLILAQPRPSTGSAIPTVTDSGLFVFGIDPEAGESVLGDGEIYADDRYYRANDSDLGFDADLDERSPSLSPNGERVATGIKYHRNGDEGGEKQRYNPSWAMDRCHAHAIDFLSQRRIQLSRLEEKIGRPALATVRLEAEFLGLSWHEGPLWLEEVLRRSGECRDELMPITPTEYLSEATRLPVCQPEISSLGTNGFHQDWINEETAWFWPHLHHAISTFASLEKANRQPETLEKRALALAGSVLRRSQSADWLALMRNHGWMGMAMEKTVELLKVFNLLATEVENKTLDMEKLDEIEKRLAEIKRTDEP